MKDAIVAHAREIKAVCTPLRHWPSDLQADKRWDQERLQRAEEAIQQGLATWKRHEQQNQPSSGPKPPSGGPV